jgi:hypothetical protein
VDGVQWWTRWRERRVVEKGVGSFCVGMEIEGGNSRFGDGGFGGSGVV